MPGYPPLVLQVYQRVKQALDTGLVLSAYARVALIEHNGSHLPQGVRPRVLAIPEKSVVRLCQVS